jgi:hypothetical protein
MQTAPQPRRTLAGDVLFERTPRSREAKKSRCINGARTAQSAHPAEQVAKETATNGRAGDPKGERDDTTGVETHREESPVRRTAEEGQTAVVRPQTRRSASQEAA